jgi:hypothetical protein
MAMSALAAVDPQPADATKEKSRFSTQPIKAAPAPARASKPKPAQRSPKR